jgi:beta-mannanase
MASGGAVTSTGGVGRTGGASGTGGSPVTGGANATGGATVGQDAGPPDKDASPATGGVLTSGGKTASGGSTALGGNAASGGSATQDALPPQDVGPNTNSDASSIPGCSAVPVTPNAIPQVSKVLCYLYSQYGNHILSGQEEGGSDSEINYIFTNTGKYPAIRAFEANGAGAGTRCVSYWNAGGLCMFGYHMGAPSTADGYNGSKTKLTPSIADALTAGTANNTVLNQRLSGLADRLLAVQAANGVVIFRPYHEAGGTWFWWSMETGADFVKLWKYTFDFMVSKGVKNTIWLLALDGSAKSAFYPGPQYVDIGGADNYNKAYDYSPMTSIYTNTAKIFPTGMPIALHECGPVPDPDQLQSTKTNWVFFSIWTSPYPETFSTVAELQKVYTSSYVVSRDELPNLK